MHLLGDSGSTTKLVQEYLKYLTLFSFLRQQVKRLVSSSTIQTISGLASANLLGATIAVIGTLVQARFVTPDELGYFRGFSIATGYAFFLHLGFFGALERFYPYYVGKGEKDRAFAIAKLCQAWNIAVTCIVSGAFTLLAVVFLVNGNWRAMLGWLVQAVVIASYFYGGYLSVIYRSTHKFTTLAKSTVLSSIVSSFTLPLFLLYPYVALALRSSLGVLASLFYIHIHRPVRLRWHFKWREWFDTAKVGLPLFTASYGAGIGWDTIERSLVLMYLGTKSLGLWAMSFMLLEAMKIVPQAIASVYLPRVTETFGRTENIKESMRLCYKPMLWGAPLILLMVIGVIAILPIIIPFLMPKYTDAVPTMSLMILYLPLIIINIPYALLVAMGKLTQQNFATYFSLASFIILALVAVKLGLGLRGMVAASLLGKAIRLSLIYYFIYTARR